MKKTLKTISVVGLVVLLLLILAARHRARIAGGGSFGAMQYEPAATDRDIAAALRGLGGTEQPAAPGKPWVTQFAGFVNGHAGRQWVVGRSQHPCLSESEAARQARANAAEKVFPILVQRLGAGRMDSAWLHQRVVEEVCDGRLDADRCAEQFSRPYGQVWTESVLLDVSPDRLEPLVRQYSTERQVRHDRQLGRAVAAVAITTVLWLGYLLLNSITRGYFSTRLRLAAGALTVAVVALLV